MTDCSHTDSSDIVDEHPDVIIHDIAHHEPPASERTENEKKTCAVISAVLYSTEHKIH